eukprot:1148820-Pelagomonas_calceolata.AAC.4
MMNTISDMVGVPSWSWSGDKVTCVTLGYHSKGARFQSVTTRAVLRKRKGYKAVPAYMSSLAEAALLAHPLPAQYVIQPHHGCG